MLIGGTKVQDDKKAELAPRPALPPRDQQGAYDNGAGPDKHHLAPSGPSRGQGTRRGEGFGVRERAPSERWEPTLTPVKWPKQGAWRS